MTRTDNLVSFIRNLKYEDLPDDVIQAAKELIFDTFGIGIGAHKYHPQDMQWIYNSARYLGSASTATALVTGERMSAPAAAMVNTMLCTDLDYDDTHKAALAHFGAQMASAALAVGQEVGASGKDIILAVVIGYEVAARVAMVVMPSHYDYFLSTSTNGTFGVAALTGRLMGLNEEQLLNTLGNAAMQASGLLGYLESGDDGYPFGSGKASFNGIFAAVAAKYGAKGHHNVLEAKKGYGNAYCVNKKPKFEKIDENLGTQWEILTNCAKPFPCLQAGQGPVEALLHILNTNNIKAEDIKSINERTYNVVVTHMSNRDPQSMIGAQVSVPYLLAVTALKGKMDLTCVQLDVIKSKEVRDMMKKVFITTDPETDAMYPEKFPCFMTVETNDGKKYQHNIMYPKGDINNPFTFEEKCVKFRSLVVPVLGEKRAEEIIDATMRLEALENAEDFAKLLIK